MTTFHLLNGDCLAAQLAQTKINENHIVCRECLIDGDLLAENLADFWAIRAKFIVDSYNATTEEYFNKTVNELEKINNLPDHSEVCLWFENDLFCQVNMWFVISLLAEKTTLKIYRIFPIIENETELWKGFGNADAKKLEQAFFSKKEFSKKDIDLGKNLWKAYQNGNLSELKTLSKTKSDCFEFLEEVCQAHIERKTLGRPENVVKEIIKSGVQDFESVFSEFSKREGIYGFGDLQVKSIFER